MTTSLSRRFLFLTILFVMLSEVLIFIPSIARFRVDYLQDKVQLAKIARMALTSTDQISQKLASDLRAQTGAYMIAVSRDDIRQLVISSEMSEMPVKTVDLREQVLHELIFAAIARLADPSKSLIRVLDTTDASENETIEIVLPSQALRDAMIDYALRILYLSAFISILTATLLFFVVRRLILRPIKGVVGSMQQYARAPQDSRHLMEPRSRTTELREAESALRSLQEQLTSALRQNQRLVQLGTAVAKISHDLRNILTSVQLFADRIDESEDPMVRRLGPKMIASVQRAVSLTETTLAFGKAEEPAPSMNRVDLNKLVEDVLESEGLGTDHDRLRLSNDVALGFTLRCDGEQLYRVLSNLVRNARQAGEARPAHDMEICVFASESDDAWRIWVKDTGPGLPAKAQENLFQAFSSTTRRGGSGLGLAIAHEMVAGHGGQLVLEQTGAGGSVFRIDLPKGSL